MGKQLSVVFVGLVAILCIFFGTTWYQMSVDVQKIATTCKEAK